MGMDYRLYYDGDPALAKAYRRAHEIRQREKNRELWLQGLYFYDALCDASPLFLDFQKRRQPLPYPDRPYPQTKAEIAEVRRQEERKEMERMKGFMERYTVQNNLRMKAKQAQASDNDGKEG